MPPAVSQKSEETGGQGWPSDRLSSSQLHSTHGPTEQEMAQRAGLNAGNSGHITDGCFGP